MKAVAWEPKNQRVLGVPRLPPASIISGSNRLWIPPLSTGLATAMLRSWVRDCALAAGSN
jgi:hypothetical protein